MKFKKKISVRKKLLTRSEKNLKRKTSYQIRPGIEPSLKSVFSRIGVPDKRPFVADAFQKKAIQAVGQGDCLVTAATGSGKTYIAEQAIEKIYREGKRAWYASPLKALSNAIYSAFTSKFGFENVGILTGDRKENPEAAIIIGTTEILRNQLYDAMHMGEDIFCDLVILDEAHFLGDSERGVVWEETIIYMPQRVSLLMLSATVGNAKELVAWIESLRHQPCTHINFNRRPVPLYPLFFHSSGTLYPFLANSASSKTPSRSLHRAVTRQLSMDRPPYLAPPGKLPDMAAVMRVLRQYKLLPAIFFLKSRADCDLALKLCSEEVLRTDPERAGALRLRMRELSAYWPYAASHAQGVYIEKKAVAAHHSGHLPGWKMLVETLMAEGLLDAVFATSTVAAGVNFPARSVIVLNSDRFNGEEFMPLSSTEFHQMTGRAGRRGKDLIGFVIALPGKFMDLRHFGRLLTSAPSPVKSQIRIDFSMCLNLLLSHDAAMVYELLQGSFAAFSIAYNLTGKQSEKARQGAARLLFADFLRHLDFLREKNFVDKDNKLSKDGIWAAKLRIDQPILVAEAFRLGLFPDDPLCLAALMACFVNEREADDRRLLVSEIPEKLLKAFTDLKSELKDFVFEMMEKNFAVSPLYLTPALSLYNWVSGKSWEEVCRDSDLAEGDLVRLFLRTAENLAHLASLEEFFPLLAKNSITAREQILREPVTDAYLL